MAIELANHIYRDGEGVPVVLMNAYPVAVSYTHLTLPTT